MGSSSIDALGYVAAAITSVSALPQVFHVVRGRSARDVSLFAVLALSTGLVLWLVYGALLGNMPLIASNIVALSINGVLITIKLGDGRIFWRPKPLGLPIIVNPVVGIDIGPHTP